MKKWLVIASLLVTNSALAETRICTDATNTVTAEITETYIGVLLIRKLHRIEENSVTIYRSWLGLTDDGGEGQQLTEDLSVKMYSGGMTLKSSQGEVTLECGPGY